MLRTLFALHVKVKIASFKYKVLDKRQFTYTCQLKAYATFCARLYYQEWCIIFCAKSNLRVCECCLNLIQYGFVIFMVLGSICTIHSACTIYRESFVLHFKLLSTVVQSECPRGSSTKCVCSVLLLSTIQYVIQALFSLDALYII
jgi:hypothetical protein